MNHVSQIFALASIRNSTHIPISNSYLFLTKNCNMHVKIIMLYVKITYSACREQKQRTIFISNIKIYLYQSRDFVKNGRLHFEFYNLTFDLNMVL